MRPPFIFCPLLPSKAQKQQVLPPCQDPFLELFLGACACAFVRAFRNYGVILTVRNTISEQNIRYRAKSHPPLLNRLLFINSPQKIGSSSNLLPIDNADIFIPRGTSLLQSLRGLETQCGPRYTQRVSWAVEGCRLAQMGDHLLELKNRVRSAEERCEGLKSQNESMVLQIRNKERECSQLREERNSTKSEIKETRLEALKEQAQRYQSWARKEQQYMETIQALKRQIRDSKKEREAACAEIKIVMGISEKMRLGFQRVVANQRDILRSLRESKKRNSSLSVHFVEKIQR